MKNNEEMNKILGGFFTSMLGDMLKGEFKTEENNKEDDKECECVECKSISLINEFIRKEEGLAEFLGKVAENDLSEETREILSENLLSQARKNLRFAIKNYAHYYAYSLNFKKDGAKDEK